MSEERPQPVGRTSAVVASVLATAATLLALDLTWLGVVARGFYDAQLGALKRADAYAPAALSFYAMYVAAIVVHAVLGAASASSAARRGAALGLLAYGTFDLTNWAVLRDWPAAIVPVDMGWGIFLTAVASLAGRLVYGRVLARAA